jgi:uroporphyrinogen decarboxylase
MDKTEVQLNCTSSGKNDGIHGMVPADKMSPGAAKLRDFYAVKPNAPIYQNEFGFYCLDRWKSEGHIDDKTNFAKLFGYDEPGSYSLGELGWCEAAFCPEFDVEILEDRGEYEVERDFAGRHVLYFKGRRNGFMPEYVDHPVKDRKTWNDNCKWRLDPNHPDRFKDLEARMGKAAAAANQGKVIVQNIVGGYMYLRSMIGPVDLLYKFYDDPELIRDCMETWLQLADAVVEKHQKYVTLDEIFLAEDICYNHGSLISHDMIKEFLFPYYQQLIANAKLRQIDKNRKLHIQIDTDGNAIPVIDLYKEIGMDYMSPFEAAAGCDVVKVAEKYPDLRIRGGFDKRILAQGKDAIDREVDRIMPTMKKRGGYIPTCDHGVPEEVNFEDYVHFRKRMLEFA